MKVFDRLIRAYLKDGVSAFAGGRPGNKKKIGRHTYAMLLADVENAKAGNIKESEKLRQLAKNGCLYARDPERKWWTVPTIKTHLREARQLAKTDKRFAARVEEIREWWTMLLTQD
jgi:hypothetical protein